jgi:hypothetical protein
MRDKRLHRQLRILFYAAPIHDQGSEAGAGGQGICNLRSEI